jgi:hypothetical protein
MSEWRLHASPTIRDFRIVGIGGRFTTAAAKNYLKPDLGRAVARSELDRVEKASKSRNKGDRNA